MMKMFPGMHLYMPLVAWIWCFIFTLIPVVEFFPGILLDMHFEEGRITARKVARCALVCGLSPVWMSMWVFIVIFKLNDLLHCGQMNLFTPVWTYLLVMGKVTSPWSKTQVTRYLFLHLLSITSSLVWRTLQIQIISTANSPFWKPT